MRGGSGGVATADPCTRFVLVLVLVLICGGVPASAAETYCFDAPVPDNGCLYEPTDIAVDAAGTILVADGEGVLGVSPAGALFGIPPPPYPGSPVLARGLAADGDRVYIADSGRRRVVVYQVDGTYLGAWESNATAGSFFLNPAGMGLDPDGHICVTDSGTSSVEIFFPNGTPFLHLENGLGSVNLSSPMDVAVNSTGWIFVADAGSHAVRFMRPNGTGLDLGGWGEAGTDPGQFRSPVGIAIDAADNVYVADRDNHRVQKFTAGGTFVATWGTNGSSPGELRYAEGVAVDGNGTVFVSDTGNRRVQRYRQLLPVPGGSGWVSTVAGNGPRCEDVNGNNRPDFADVVLYFDQMSWIAANEPMAAFDYNGNGRIDFADVVWLFTHL